MISERSINDARRLIKSSEKPRVVLRDSGSGGVGGLELVIGRKVEAFAFAWTPRGLGPDGKRAPTRRIKLGNYVPGYSIADARRDANDAKREVQAGGDPMAGRRAKTAAQATVRSMLEIYAERRLSGLRQGAEQRRALTKDLPDELQKLPLRELRLHHIAATVDGLRARQPGRAEHLWRYAAAFLSWCCDQGHVDTNPLAGRRNPVRQRSRERVLDARELAAVLRATGSELPPFGPFLRMLFATAARREEVAAIRWREVDLQAMTWTLPAERSKTDQEYAMPLAKSVAELLAEHRRLYGGEQDHFVFTTTAGVRPVSGFSKFKRRLDAESGVTDWVFHDVRRCFATWAIDQGHPPALVDRCLNHHGAASSSTVLRVYNRASLFTQRRALMEDWSRHLDDVRDGCGSMAGISLARSA